MGVRKSLYAWHEAWYLLGQILHNRGIRTGSESTLDEARDCLQRFGRGGH